MDDQEDSKCSQHEKDHRDYRRDLEHRGTSKIEDEQNGISCGSIADLRRLSYGDFHYTFQLDYLASRQGASITLCRESFRNPAR